MDSYAFGQPADGQNIWGMRLRWATAGLLVTLAHGAVVWLAVSWRPAPAEAAEPAQGMVIELAAWAVDPELAEVDIPPSPDMVKTEPTPPEETSQPEVAEPQVPEQAAPEQAVVAPLPKVEDSDVVMETPKPKIEPKVEPKPTPKVVPKPVREVKPKEPKREVRHARTDTHKPERVAPPRAAAASRLSAQTGAAAPVAASAPVSGASMASWRGSLIAHLNRYKRFPAGANSAGSASVAFTIDRSGRVLSSSLVRSSGDAALDGEAVAMMRRASPVPQPPDNVGGRTISLAVPIRFNR
ncbi:MAG: hypothetical protein BGP04_02560 [Rhizobiales bacterium 62-17]|nr:energy transducer TonB [Hyphomicrobiales bacterium]OJY04309.1 MAG: hypothetical protein BGP04_02560 [Rhizobiales bacterium 62-17]